jgi:hypothetical protein
LLALSGCIGRERALVTRGGDTLAIQLGWSEFGDVLPGTGDVFAAVLPT